MTLHLWQLILLCVAWSIVGSGLMGLFAYALRRALEAALAIARADSHEVWRDKAESLREDGGRPKWNDTLQQIQDRRVRIAKKRAKREGG